MWVRLQLEETEPVSITSNTCWTTCLRWRNLDLSEKSTATPLFVSGDGFWWRFEFKWSVLIEAVVVLDRSCSRGGNPPSSRDNSLSLVTLLRSEGLRPSAVLLDCVLYGGAHTRVYSLMHLLPPVLFQTLSEAAWAATLVLFAVKVPVPPTHTSDLLRQPKRMGFLAGFPSRLCLRSHANCAMTCAMNDYCWF